MNTDLTTEQREPLFAPEPPCIGCGKVWPDGATYHNDRDNIGLCDNCRGPNGKGISLLDLQREEKRTIAIEPCFECGEPAEFILVEWWLGCIGHIFRCARHDPYSPPAS